MSRPVLQLNLESTISTITCCVTNVIKDVMIIEPIIILSNASAAPANAKSVTITVCFNLTVYWPFIVIAPNAMVLFPVAAKFAGPVLSFSDLWTHCAGSGFFLAYSACCCGRCPSIYRRQKPTYLICLDHWDLWLELVLLMMQQCCLGAAAAIVMFIIIVFLELCFRHNVQTCQKPNGCQVSFALFHWPWGQSKLILFREIVT